MENDITFLHKNIISEYEIATKVEYKITTWESISSKLDLTWAKNKDYKCIQSLDELKAVVKELKKVKFIAVDTETSGLNIYNLSWKNPIKDHICGMSLSWRANQGIYIPFAHRKFKNVALAEALVILKPILEQKKCILHNAMFDYKVFYDLGVNLNVAHDTMSMLFHINTLVSKGGKGLKDNIKKIFGIDTLDLETMTGEKRYAAMFSLLDKKLCTVYGCADTDFCLSLFLYLLPYLDKRQYDGYLLDIQMIPILAKMEYYGRQIDMAKLPKFNAINNEDITTLKTLIYKYVGTYINIESGKPEEGLYLFNFNSADELSNILYNILKLPILDISEKTNKPKTDALVFDTFLREKVETPDPAIKMLIKTDLESGYAKLGKELGKSYGEDGFLGKLYSKGEGLYELKYPIIFLLKELRKRIKFKTSFFGKLLTDNMEGKYFTSVSLTSAETHRIIDPAQTLPAFLKELIIPFANHYMIDEDYSQIEARVFSSLSHSTELIDRLTLPWTDFHRENGAKIFKKKPENISKKERSKLKVVNFGIPFAMTKVKMALTFYGKAKNEILRKEHEDEMDILIKKWIAENPLIWDMLEQYRAEAIKVCKDEKVVSFFGNKQVGKIYNPYGDARVFDLHGVVDDSKILDKTKYAAIKRQAGNFPIQSTAARYYKQGVINLFRKLKEDNLINVKVKDPDRPLGYRFENFVILVGTVHDESVLCVHNNISEYYMIECTYNECMLRIEGHAPYYMGISFADNWGEGHSSDVELGIEFVQYILKIKSDEAGRRGLTRIPISRTTTENPKFALIKQAKEFTDNQICEELCKLGHIIIANNNVIGTLDVNNILDNFSNYALKTIVMNYKVNQSLQEQLRSQIQNISTEGESNSIVILGGLLQVLFNKYKSIEYVEIRHHKYHGRIYANSTTV